MTLILTATCRDGIAVCADKRRTVKTAQQTIHKDELQKLYYFSKVAVLAYNHAINRIRGRDWDHYLKDFEAAFVRPDMDFDYLVEKFKDFFGSSVSHELATNPFDDAVGFVFCTTSQGAKPVVRELFWQKNRPLVDQPHEGLIRTGVGGRYLNDHLAITPEVNTVRHWSQLTVEEGLSELIALFRKACEERLRQGGDEFSDTYDTGILKS